MEEKIVTIVPVVESGKGCFLKITINNSEYVSDVIDDTLTSESLQKLFNDMKETFSADDIEDVEFQFEKLLDSVKKMEEEDAYRKEHPEEFMHNMEEREAIA